MRNYHISAQTVQPDGSMTAREGPIKVKDLVEVMNQIGPALPANARVTVLVIVDLGPVEPDLSLIRPNLKVVH